MYSYVMLIYLIYFSRDCQDGIGMVAPEVDETRCMYVSSNVGVPLPS